MTELNEMVELNESEMDSVNGGTVIGPGPNNDLTDDPDIITISPCPPSPEPINEQIDGRIGFFVQEDKRPKHYR